MPRRSSSPAAARPTPATRCASARHTRAAAAGRLVVEDEGKSPLAWQGGRLSKLIAELAARGVVMGGRPLRRDS